MLKRGSVYIAGLLLNAIVLSTLILSRPITAVACPDEVPKTLLQLYKNSETIYVARFAKTEKGDIIKKEDYQARNVKKYFDVSTTLKGEAKKMFVLDQEEYVYDGPEPEPPADAEHAEDHSEEIPEHLEEEFEGARVLKEGDTVLLFLKRDEEDKKKVVLADYADGARIVEPSEVKTYERRIRELNAIFAGKKADDAKIVDWLVSVAEDPITRWDGTLELLQSFENAEYLDAQEKEQAENAEIDERTPDDDKGTIIEDEPEQVIEDDLGLDSAVYASLLTEAHKQRLSQILINREQSSKALIKGDAELIELVKRWGDSEVGRVLVEKVRSGAYQPYETARMMASAGQIFKDAELSKLAVQYEEVAWADPNEEVYSESEDQAADQAEKKNDAEPKAEAEKAGSADKVEAKPAKKRPTYGEQRAGFFSSFLARADKLIAKQQAAAQKKQ